MSAYDAAMVEAWCEPWPGDVDAAETALRLAQMAKAEHDRRVALEALVSRLFEHDSTFLVDMAYSVELDLLLDDRYYVTNADKAIIREAIANSEAS